MYKRQVVGSNKGIFRQTDREQSLVGLMRVNILKRLESSINSFAITVENILYKIYKALEAIEQRQFDYDAELDINDIDIDDPCLLYTSCQMRYHRLLNKLPSFLSLLQLLIFFHMATLKENVFLQPSV